MYGSKKPTQRAGLTDQRYFPKCLPKTLRALRMMQLRIMRANFANPPHDDPTLRFVQHIGNAQARVGIYSAHCVLCVPLGMGEARIGPTHTRLSWALPCRKCGHCHIRRKAYQRTDDRLATRMIKRIIQRTDPTAFFSEPITENAAFAISAIAVGSTLRSLLDALCKTSSARERLAAIARWPFLADWEPADLDGSL